MKLSQNPPSNGPKNPEDLYTGPLMEAYAMALGSTAADTNYINGIDKISASFSKVLKIDEQILRDHVYAMVSGQLSVKLGGKCYNNEEAERAMIKILCNPEKFIQHLFIRLQMADLLK